MASAAPNANISGTGRPAGVTSTPDDSTNAPTAASDPYAGLPSAQSMMSDLDTAVAKATAGSQAAAGMKQKAAQDWASTVGDITAQQEQLRQQFAAQNKPFQAPETQDPLHAFGSVASIMAALGGFLTSSPLTSSLNSLSSGIEAIKAGNSAAYDKAYKEWDANTKAALDASKFQNEQLQNILNNKKLGYDAQVSAADAFLTATNDPLAKQTLREKGVEGLYSLVESRQKIEAELEKSHAQMQQINAGIWDAETVQKAAEQYLAGDRSVLQNMGRNQAGAINRAALEREVVNQANQQGMSGADIAQRMAEFEGVKAGERALGMRSANVGMAVNEASQFADLLIKASDAVPRSNFVPANQALLSWQENTGDPNVVQYGAALNSFINAYARAVAPTGQGPSVADKEHARDMLQRAHSQAQVHAVVDQLKKEMSAAKQAPVAVKQELRGLAGSSLGGASAIPQGAQGSSAGQFTEGQVYTDANGTKARYQGGQWIPVQ